MDESPRIKVTDRRLFTPDGELREDAEPPADDGEEPSASSTQRATPPPDDFARAGGTAHAPAAEAPPASPAAQGAGAEPSTGWARDERVSILDLVGLLAEPIALYLGDLELPDGQRTVDLDQARVYIDLLGVLQEKTRGNLSGEEEAVLSDLVYRLKMRYVQKRESA
jgi:hypothetical protein